MGIKRRSIPLESIVLTIAEGLDESYGGTGWTAKHQRAADLANLAPRLADFVRLVAAGNTEIARLETLAQRLVRCLPKAT